ncbi:MAG: chloride channel protein [Rhodospirillaceae bacterium]|nr:chloride channel protein [Rhodospirillaceae bacterium]
MKIAATSFTLGSGASGGVIAPPLFVGCMLGGACGAFVNHLLPGTSASGGAYALVAMGALVASTIRTPMTSILMIFEMTGNYELILPLAVSVIVSAALSAYLLKPSVYSLRLLRRNAELEKGEGANILRSLNVGQARVASFETIPPQAPLDDLMSRLAESTDTEFYITDDAERYQGQSPATASEVSSRTARTSKASSWPTPSPSSTCRQSPTETRWTGSCGCSAGTRLTPFPLSNRPRVAWPA